MVGDDTPVIEAVLACDAERTELLAEEAELLAKLNKDRKARPRACVWGGGEDGDGVVGGVVRRGVVWCGVGWRGVVCALSVCGHARVRMHVCVSVCGGGPGAGAGPGGCGKEVLRAAR